MTSSPTLSGYALQILSGPGLGMRHPLGDSFLLGRAPHCDLVFSGMEGRLVSGEHARLSREGEGYVLEDLRSTNGTWVNNERVERRSLQHQDILSLGAGGPRLRFLSLAEEKANPARGTLPGTFSAPALNREPPLPGPPGEPAFPGRETPSRGDPSSTARSLPSPDPSVLPTGPDRSRPDRRKSAAAPLNPPPPRGPAASFPGEAGDFTMGLGQRLRDDEAGAEEIRDLIKDKGRVERLVGSGQLSGKEARMLSHASATYSGHRKQALWSLAIISGLALIVITVLGVQNLRYRSKLAKQERLLEQIHSLEDQVEHAGGAGEADEEKAEMVARLRAAERQLMDLRSTLNAKDLAVTYKDPLGREIHAILRDFGKQNYIVPDIFIQQVNRHIQTFTTTKSRGILVRSFANKPRHHRLIEEELRRAGMPVAFFYLAMHESLLDSTIVSPAGARGLWQFMPATARDYGLAVPDNWRELPAHMSHFDERTLPFKSTRAGVRYLKNLMAEFGDVALAMAAYNAGEGRIRGALRKIDDPLNNRDFWYIYRMGTLAEETNQYVPKIIATMIIDKNRARYGFPPG